jgi:hypothetical protein
MMDRLKSALQAIAPTETYPDLRGDYVTSPSGLVLPEAHDPIDLFEGAAA